MTRTRRRKKHGGDRPEKPERDGRGGIYGRGLPPGEFAIEVTRRERRAQENEVGKLQRGDVDPDDAPTKPLRSKLWEWWKRW